MVVPRVGAELWRLQARGIASPSIPWTGLHIEAPGAPAPLGLRSDEQHAGSGRDH